MVPFPYSPWPFLDFGQDPDPNGAPPVPNVPGVTIPWSTLPPIAPTPSAPPPPALPPVVPPTNSPPPQPTFPPSDTPGFDKTFAPPQPPPPPVAQAPRNPSLADIIAPWMQSPQPEPPPPALPPSETPGLDKAIARMNAPTPGFNLTPGLGGFTQPPMWSLPPPPQLLSLPPPLPVPSGGGLGALASHLPPLAPAPSPLTLAGNVSAPTLPQPDIGPDIPETLRQMARRLAPYATEMGAAIGRTLPSVGAAGAGAFAAAPILITPFNTGATTLDLGDGLRATMPPGQRYVPIERKVAPGVFGSDTGATWKQVPGLYGEVDPGRGVLVDPEQLREALGDEAANRILNTPGIMPMAKRPSDKQPKLPPSASSNGGSSSNGGGPPDDTDVAAAIAREVLRTVRIANMLRATARGRQFQDDVLKALEIPENKDRIPVTMNDGDLVTVIPDAQSITLITEVKDVVNLYNSKQFRAYFATNRAINLIVSPNTQTISQPLQDLIYASKGSIRVFDPATGTFTPWTPK